MEESREGIILIDKPLEWTSFDVVKKLRNLSKAKKIGHAGTLDPLATGLLILCFGKHTKKIEQLQAMPKVYTGTFIFGATTPSFDLETEVNATFASRHLTGEMLQGQALKMIGEQQQKPPDFSAVKVGGKRAYEMAREGKKLVLEAKLITIFEFELTRIQLPEVDFMIKCSKGTYIRSIARDFGQALNSGAYLRSLRRTAIGEFLVDDAFLPNDIKDQEDFYSKSFSI